MRDGARRLQGQLSHRVELAGREPSGGDFDSYYVHVGLGLSIFFFFQAEDGIRVHCVTGVQTCALPILAIASAACSSGPAASGAPASSALASCRSEERRVGKECRSRWSPDHSKKNSLAEMRAVGMRISADIQALPYVDTASQQFCCAGLGEEISCFFFFKQKTAYEITV